MNSKSSPRTPSLAKADRLMKLSFGGDVAEHEEQLDTYFLRTPAFWAMVEDEVDVILGAKGSGKSAIARYLSSPTVDIEQVSNVLVMPAFNIRGSVLYKRLVADHQDLNEDQYRDLFMALMVGLAGNYVIRTFDDAVDVSRLEAALREAGLVVDDISVDTIWRRALRRIRPRVRTTVGFDPTGMPVLSGSAEFGTDPDRPTTHEQSGTKDILEVTLELLYEVLERLDLRCWVVFDRLDEAFPNNLDLERLALRGLLRAHMDATSYGSRFRSKLFLRLDIFERITEKVGFVNATHLRTLRISWDSDSILHMITMRLYESDGDPKGRAYIHRHMNSITGRRAIVRSIMPQTVNEIQSLIWLMLVTTDASREFNPRNILTLLRFARAEAIQMTSRGSGDKALLPARALSAAFRQLSKARLEDTILAESQTARTLIDQLRGRKTKFSIAQLSTTLRLTEADLDTAIRDLRYVGFLRLDGDNYIVPPLFRPAIFVAVHGAELRIEAPQDDLGGAAPGSLRGLELDATDEVSLSAADADYYIDGGDVSVDSIEDDADTIQPKPSPLGVATPKQPTESPTQPGRKRRSRRRRGKATDRDELVPTGMHSDDEHEADFAGLLAEELPDEVGPSTVAPMRLPNTPLPPEAPFRPLPSHTQSISTRVHTAREMGQQGQPLAGFHLLWPTLAGSVGPMAAASDLAFASRDLTALFESRRALSALDAGQGAVAGRLLVLDLLDESPNLAASWQTAGAVSMASVVPAILRIISMAPAEEPRFWKRSLSAVATSPKSALSDFWPVMAACRVLAMCRHSWDRGIDSETLRMSTMRDQLWDVEAWPAAKAQITDYLRNFANDRAKDSVQLLPYQIISLAAIGEVEASDPALHEALVGQLTQILGESEANHQDRFLEWAKYSSMVLLVRFPRNVRASRAQAVLLEKQSHPRPTEGVDKMLEEILSSDSNGDRSEILLSELGIQLRDRWPGFSPGQYGSPTLYHLLQIVASTSPRMELHRGAGGHPFIRRVEPPQ